ncbi:MAG: hypothetical protein QXN36_00595 [Candidatus Bathyarchaeia archaeon]
MKKLKALMLALVALLPIFAAAAAAYAFESSIYGRVIVTYAIPPTDDSMTNPDYKLLSYHWYTTINYYINPSNKYGFSTTAVVNTITASAYTWDKETAYQVFSYRGTTTRTAGRRDGYNVVSWGAYQAGVIAVTYIWASGSRIVETDCRMNTYYTWSLSGEAGKFDVQNIMTHEFGHWCGLADLYNDVDYWLTMYGYANYGETYKRTLGLGDILGLEAVYGA